MWDTIDGVKGVNRVAERRDRSNLNSRERSIESAMKNLFLMNILGFKLIGKYEIGVAEDVLVHRNDGFWNV